jgi:DNA-directed RNA polymerase specialized sigma subunit
VELVATEPGSEADRQRHERTSRLLAAAAESEGDRRGILLAEVVELHMCLVDALVASHQGCFVATEDLRRVAFLALVKAVGDFEPDRADAGFQSAAEVVINSELCKHLATTARSSGHGSIPPAPRHTANSSRD